VPTFILLAPGVSQGRSRIMLGFDGTGPHGMGLMTGGGRGYCVVLLNDQETELDCFYPGDFTFV
jgi:hypothetical protein